ncbi:hypothetical protein OD91_0822 [Lutibacter sp. Hel_I_33_5]|uniref:hypothetical protein n=1 Tax=Lutibacter sp. Hel_I_33_5 TaxID=1566289 RepID=UPI0011AE12B9|nr:hypothetical protein [Lutibacter sp. Hel_I_33_5]TVZ55567.1 hypothetical protein OD91_0822 [Lutibacter sp. Hel_I_33_5]
MKKIFFIFLLISSYGFSQDMTIDKLDFIIKKNADSTAVNGNSWNFAVNGKLMICIADKNANRMRIISPISKQEKLSEELLLNSLIANFHTALDVKYAISDGVLWSVFIHPLKELSTHQVEDAISQVYYASETFGTIYTSTNLTFPGNTKKKKEVKKKPVLEKI